MDKIYTCTYIQLCAIHKKKQKKQQQQKTTETNLQTNAGKTIYRNKYQYIIL